MKKIFLIAMLAFMGSACNAFSKPEVINRAVASTATSAAQNYMTHVNQGGVVLFTRDGCSFCSSAKSLLDGKGINYTQVSVDNEPAMVNDLVAKTNHRTFPFIFVNKQFIGGYRELKKLADSGGL